MWRVGVRIMVVSIVTAAAVATSAQQHPPANAVQWTAVTGDYLESETFANNSFSHEDVLRLDSGAYLVVHGLRDHLSAPPQSAVDRFTISSASVLHSDMWINPDAVVTISHSKTSRARKAIPNGVRTVLAVLVEDGAAHLPQLITSSADLSDRVFGTSGSTFNAKSQFTACSHGAVTLVPGTGTNVVDGAIQVVANTYVAGSKLVDTMNTVMPALNAKLGGAGAESTYDLIMLILPGEDFVASAFVGGTVSQFGGGATTHVSTHMHEIGHNFRLAHANENGEEYDDTTGVMGYATSAKSNSNRGPRQCFNPAKNFQLGWYTARTATQVTCTMSTPTAHTLVGVADVGNVNLATTDMILTRLQFGNDVETYIGFNHAAGPNAGTQEGINEVTIQDRPPGSGNAQSNLVAKLGTGDTYTGADGSFVVSVVEINTIADPPYASILVGCTGSLPPPAGTPTSAPTASPIGSPPSPTTASPTASPTIPGLCAVVPDVNGHVDITFNSQIQSVPLPTESFAAFQNYRGAFEGCADLVTVTIFGGVTTIDLQAFHNCSNLATVKMSNQHPIFP